MKFRIMFLAVCLALAGCSGNKDDAPKGDDNLKLSNDEIVEMETAAEQMDSIIYEIETSARELNALLEELNPSR